MSDKSPLKSDFISNEYKDLNSKPIVTCVPVHITQL